MPISAAPAPDAAVLETKVEQTSWALPPFVFVAFMALAGLGTLTTNPLLTAASLLALPLIIQLVWRPGEPPALAFVFVFHWIQTTVKVFYADMLGVDVSEIVMFRMMGDYADLRAAIWLTLAGTLIAAAGVRLAIRSLPPPDREALLAKARMFSISRTFWLYLAITLTVTTLLGVVGYMSGLRQIVEALRQLKWVPYFLLVYLGLSRREGYGYVITAFAFEFISGIGFFSGFKEVLFVTVIAYFTARSRITLGAFAKSAAVVMVMAVIGVAWTVVKPEYRTLIGEKGSQGTTVSQEEQIGLLVSLLSQLDRDALAQGFEPLVDRLSYVDFFAYTLEFVPAVLPHEDGALWGAAVKHVSMPRILFPNKPPIVSDSEITNRYTGLLVAGQDEGTSFSIGYMAESFVDFGPWLMFFPIFLSGLVRGWMYRYYVRVHEFSQVEGIQLLGYGFAIALFSRWYTLEAATGKLLGAVLMQFIVLTLLFRFVGPSIISWLRNEPEASEELDERVVEVPMQQAWT